MCGEGEGSRVSCVCGEGEGSRVSWCVCGEGKGQGELVYVRRSHVYVE